MSWPIRGQGSHLVFLISPKNTNWVEDVEILISCQVSFNSVQWFQRSQKCLSQSEPWAAILFFQSAWKTQTWLRMLRSCFLSSFVEICSAVSEEKLKMSQPIRGQGGHLVSPIGPKNTNLVEDISTLDLASCQVWLNSGLFLTLSGTWPMALELRNSRHFAQKWEFLANYFMFSS